MHIFLTAALVGGKWPAPNPGRYSPRERAPSTHWIRVLVGPKAGMGEADKRHLLNLPGFELRTLGRPAHSHSLYRLRYPGSYEGRYSN
jgi:hypothetical protein